MDNTAVAAFDGAPLFPESLLFLHVELDLALLVTDIDKLVGYLVFNVFSGHFMLHNILKHVVIDMILICDFELVFEATAPVAVFSEVSERRHEAVA